MDSLGGMNPICSTNTDTCPVDYTAKENTVEKTKGKASFQVFAVLFTDGSKLICLEKNP